MKGEKEMPNYWVVGAMWEGHGDHLDEFIRCGYWRHWWTREEQPVQVGRCDQIEAGDRIAIKRMLGHGAPDIEIRALGLVTGTDDSDEEYRRVRVDWCITDLEREVRGNGCFASIHGPFDEDDEWTQEVFLGLDERS